MSWKHVLRPALVALAFASVELLTAPAGEPSVGVGAGDVLFAVGLLSALHVAAALAARRLGSRALVVPVVLWAMVWGPEQARRRGLPAGVGWAAPLALAAVGVKAPAVSAVLSLAGGVAPGDAGTPQASCRDCPDLVLVTVDTVREDAALASTMAEAGWQVGAALAPAPWTPPAMHSILLGAPVLVHGGGVETSQGLTARPDSFIGLAESLQSLGFSTAAFVSHPPLRQEAGFREGFSVWAHAARAPAPMLLLRTGRLGMARWLGHRRSAGRTDQDLVNAARRWLRSTQDGGRFLWLHLMGPHAWPREDATGEAPQDDSPAARRRR
ncbi:MAG: sulfatase-like hydrolase/transferase, partial [Myxococcota bacterium]|nr:sulfatase-like hydrolase/transferase [Myxococcota bacterium]